MAMAPWVNNDEQVKHWLHEYGDYCPSGDESYEKRLETGEYPPLETWLWNKGGCGPVFIKDGVTYLFDYNTWEFEAEPDDEDQIILGRWGEERWKYLADHRYGEWFGLLCSGELRQHCKEIEEQADEREWRMIRERMKPFESLKDTDPIRYGRVWNNEMASVREVIRAELIYPEESESGMQAG